MTEEKDAYYEHYRFVADKGQQPLRIDKFLVNRIENASRSKIQSAAQTSCILVNDVAVKPNYKVKPGDQISIVLPDPPRDEEIIPENIPLDIVFEDDHIIVVNKKAGMVVHPGYANYTGTLVNALMYHAGQLPESDNKYVRPGLVHRLDKDTSGLIVAAKTEAAMSLLAKQFYDHSIHRLYIALAWGDFKEDEGTIEGNLARSPKDRRVVHVTGKEDEGRHAVTHYKVIERLGYVTLIECRLETGRTHQIRAHMKHIGHPLFNDAMYGGDLIRSGTIFTKYKQFIDNCFKVLDRQALHAKYLGFIHPATAKEVVFESEMPEDMANVIEKWRNYVKYR